MNTLSFHRIKNLFASYFISNWGKDGKTFLIVFAVNLFLAAMFNGRSLSISFAIVFIMCLIYAGRIFGNLGNNGAINYLSLPANTSEKLLTNISLSHIYYPLALFIVSILGVLCGNLLLIFQDRPFPMLDLELGGLNYNYIINLAVLLSIFMFGSVYFRKNAISKLLLVFVVLLFIFMIILFTIGLQIFLPNIDLLSGMQGIYPVDLFEQFNLFFSILDYVIILFFWVLSYFRLRETEA